MDINSIARIEDIVSTLRRERDYIDDAIEAIERLAGIESGKSSEQRRKPRSVGSGRIRVMAPER